jgi:phospholipase/carboxylesterase
MHARAPLLVALVALVGLAACPQVSPRPESTHVDTAPLVYDEVVTGGASADETLPLVICLHGLGDSPAGIRSLATDFPGRARFVLPQAPTPYFSGFAWFPFYDGHGTPQQYADGVRTAATRVAELIRRVRALRPTRGATIVTGFSQGAMISYGLAAQHPELIGAAFPLSGYLPSPLLPRAGTRLPPIRSMHGDADDVVPLALDQASVAALRALGADVALHVYPGVRHTITAQMGDDLNAELAAAIAR